MNLNTLNILILLFVNNFTNIRRWLYCVCTRLLDLSTSPVGVYMLRSLSFQWLDPSSKTHLRIIQCCGSRKTFKFFIYWDTVVTEHYKLVTSCGRTHTERKIIIGCSVVWHHTGSASVFPEVKQ
jgi:hypothetical protein